MKSFPHILPKVSIITVTFQNVEGLKVTMRSVFGQNYPTLEFILVDGGSTDGTLEVIRENEAGISWWCSEQDRGIYDAMNKGIRQASGDWIIFMNAGDSFFSSQILKEVFERNSYSGYSFVYGNWQVRYPYGGTRLRKAGPVKSLWKGSQFCHQAVFISSDYQCHHPYSNQHRLVADFAFFYQAYEAGEKFMQLNIPIASIEAGGVSDQKRVVVIAEWEKVIGKNWKSKVYFTLRSAREQAALWIKKWVS